MLTAILIMALLAVILGAALGYASVKFRVEGNPLVDKIEAILPQTQCGQCGYPGCKPYAEAIASGEAEINLCPPGGTEGVRKLADLLGREVKPLDGEEKPKQRAVIDESSCIGCTLCIQACPVDAIIGAAKQMHTVAASLSDLRYADRIDFPLYFLGRLARPLTPRRLLADPQGSHPAGAAVRPPAR